ncbi:hypothetical protein CSPHI_07090 [Corynebacterium sphenisci DSM 44792]|uniref:Uncharacterized protein n=1 Tax=Corynebacterium sphenisci DSM 44792 TaxID=1437874 RepID=A0A1L7CY92_9CORY|nr:hypothetical protein [Corynebacterium sphenisci]APT90845.1 hypothetical protein CSPHI_07090 [Corynebacterium sphenisci DSM 44792]
MSAPRSAPSPADLAGRGPAGADPAADGTAEAARLEKLGEALAELTARSADAGDPVARAELLEAEHRLLQEALGDQAGRERRDG